MTAEQKNIKNEPKTPTKAAEDPVSRRSLLTEAFKGQIFRRVPTSLAYKISLFLVAAGMCLLPVLYGAMVVSITFGLFWHITSNYPLLTSGRRILVALLVYIAPIVVLTLLIFFLTKPLFARRLTDFVPLRLNRRQEPLLFGFVEELATIIGAPLPKKIYVDLAANASVAFESGWRGFFGKHLSLTIGLPLAAGLTLQQLTGVIAHEMGHFAQSTGMRLNYMINRINVWFARIVYEEDKWDRRIKRWSETLDFRLAIVFKVARWAIWGTRKILWLLMRTGHVISFQLSRQMEYDADQYEVAVAGAENFEATSRQITLLSNAAHWASQDLNESWKNNKRLADDFPALMIINRDQAPTEIKEKIFEHLNAQTTGRFDTHPSFSDRLKAAAQIETVPIFQPADDAETHFSTAAVLFTDFKHLCRRATLDYYRIRLGKQVNQENVFPVETIARQQDAEKICYDALDRFFNGQFDVRRPLGLKKGPIPPMADFDISAVVKQIDTLRRDTRKYAKEYDLTMGIYRKLHRRILQVSLARSLIQANVPFEPEAFNLTYPDPTTLAEILETARSEMDMVQGELSDFEKKPLARMETALKLLGAARVMAAIENAHRLKLAAERFIVTLCMMESALPALGELETAAHLMNVLARKVDPDEPDPGLLQAIQHKAGHLREYLHQFYQELDEIPYPFTHAQKLLSLGKYAVDHLPEMQEHADLIHTAFEAMDRFFRTYYRVSARLAYIAEKVEQALAAIAREGDDACIRVDVNLFSDFTEATETPVA